MTVRKLRWNYATVPRALLLSVVIVSVVLQCVALLPSPPILDWTFVVYAIWAFFLRPLSVRFVADGTCLRIVNPLRTYRIALRDVEDITLEMPWSAQAPVLAISYNRAARSRKVKVFAVGGDELGQVLRYLGSLTSLAVGPAARAKDLTRSVTIT
jgi:hypothetical protein